MQSVLVYPPSADTIDTSLCRQLKGNVQDCMGMDNCRDRGVVVVVVVVKLDI